MDRLRNALPVLALLILASCDGGSERERVAVLAERSFPSGTARILAFGDSGTGDAAQFAVAAGMAARQAAAPFDLALMLGDNFYETGVASTADDQFRTKFREAYPAADFPLPFLVVLGNHDYAQNPQAQYDWTDPDGRWTCPSRAYLQPLSFGDGRKADLYCVDSECFRDPAAAAELAAQIGALMDSRGAGANLLALHRPFYSSGEHGGDAALLGAFSDLLSRGRFRAVLSGHDHDLELQEMDRNGDGGPEWFIVSGAAAKSRALGTLSTATLFSKGAEGGVAFHGFAELTISASGLTVDFRAADGSWLYSRSAP